jgi:transcriptional regulator
MPIKMNKITKQNAIQRLKDAEANLSVLEPVALDNLHKIQYSLKTLLKGGANVSLIIVPVAADPKQGR